MPRKTKNSNSVDLFAIAHRSMIEAGFLPDFNGAVKKEVESLAATPPKPAAGEVRDLGALLWSSIDDSKTRDLDQLEYAEVLSSSDTRLLIGIADVDAFV